MADLPNAHLAVIEEGKVTRYLLADDHPAGRAKAAFFFAFGFRRTRWQVLRDALLVHARSAEAVAATVETDFGTKFTLEGPLLAPDGRSPRVRSIWFVELGRDRPRLVSAYPASERNDD